MADVKVQKDDRIKNLIESITDILYNLLYEMKIAPGNEIWVIRDDCDGCIEPVCRKTNKNYLEKTVVYQFNVILKENNQFELNFTDVDNNCYSIDDIHNTVFTDSREALEHYEELC